jgi:hypothetical protein
MTKVISARSDEVCGCKQAHPEDADAEKFLMKAPHDGQAHGIREGVDFHGPRSFEQSVSNLR